MKNCTIFSLTLHSLSDSPLFTKGAAHVLHHSRFSSFFAPLLSQSPMLQMSKSTVKKFLTPVFTFQDLPYAKTLQVNKTCQIRNCVFTQIPNKSIECATSDVRIDIKECKFDSCGPISLSWTDMLTIQDTAFIKSIGAIDMSNGQLNITRTTFTSNNGKPAIRALKTTITQENTNTSKSDITLIETVYDIYTFINFCVVTNIQPKEFCYVLESNTSIAQNSRFVSISGIIFNHLKEAVNCQFVSSPKVSAMNTTLTNCKISEIPSFAIPTAAPTKSINPQFPIGSTSGETAEPAEFPFYKLIFAFVLLTVVGMVIFKLTRSPTNNHFAQGNNDDRDTLIPSAADLVGEDRPKFAPTIDTDE